MKKKIIAYSAKLKPLTVNEYKALVEASIDQYNRGNVVSQREMEKRLK